jgi:hypothetical protein
MLRRRGMSALAQRWRSPGTAGYGQAGEIPQKPKDRLDFARARDKI